ncbi:SDR family oxidoreductase [Rhodovulum sp. DZ06]|uniref:SDR family oxidoreductase n=1 Tax=Rhodovulum sp. DZ06 TaxID=3425126 RepID=UPI003D344061
MTQRIVIAGATGYLGRRVVQVFKARGWRVNALVRNAAAARRAGIAPADMLVVDLQGAARLAEVMRDADAVFSAVGLTRQRDGLTYDQVDYGVNLALLKAAVKAGAPRFGYVHVLNGENMRRSALARAKSRFVKVLEGAAIEPVVIAPTAYFSDMEDFLEMARRGAVFLVGDGERRLNPIHGDDLAAVCADALIAGTRRTNVGGPDVFTQAELGALAFEALGKPPRIIRVPRALAGAAVGALKLLGPQRMWGPAEFFLEATAMDMVAGQKGKKHLAAHFKALAEGTAQ